MPPRTPGTRTDANALDLGDGPLSIECWFKRSATQGAAQQLATKGSNAYALGFLADNKLAVSKEGAGQSLATSTDAITDQGWHHVVATKNGAATKLYIDGVDVTVAGTNATLANNAISLRIGWNSAANPFRFPGSMDEVALYSAVLTADEVTQHYERGRAIFYGKASLAGSSSLAATATRSRYADAALSGEGDLVGAGGAIRSGSAALSGESSLTAAGQRARYGAAVLSGAGSLAAAAVLVRYGRATLSGESSLTAAGGAIRYGAAVLSGIGTLVAKAALESGPAHFARSTLGRASLGRASLGRSSLGKRRL